MFSSARKAAKAAGSMVGKLKPAKKDAVQRNGFAALQELDVEDDGQDVAATLQGLKLNDDNGDVHTANTPAVAAAQYEQKNREEDIEKKWTTIGQRTERRQPKTEAQPVRPAATEAPWATNWRSPDAQANRERYARAATIKSKFAKGTHRPGPRTKAGVLHADQKDGTIVFRWDVRPFPSKKVPDTDPRIFYQNGTRYLKKGRYWLVVKATGKTVWEAPIYTNNDTGLLLVPRKFWKQYFSLLPHGMPLEGFKNQSPSNKVASIDWMSVDEKDGTMRGRKMRNTMVVHFSEIMVRSIDLADVRIVGALSDFTTSYACEKARDFVSALE
ncbi:hypothetical protein LTR85_001127 [Meristemomyces frigidus]|nr:hypothetical protein LTR85_001127 [Meristemomyces frigidus]